MFQFVHEKEIQAEDDQVFLVKLQVIVLINSHTPSRMCTVLVCVY